MSKSHNIKNAIITDSFNKTINFFSTSNIKWFLNQIDWRKTELDLHWKKYYVSLDFSGWWNIESILKENKCIIVWNPWSWKTQLLVDIFLKIKNNLSKRWWFYKNNEFIPFFIALRNLWEKSLETYIDEKISKFNIKWEQKFILLLDGLDEISLEKTAEIMDFIENNQNYKYIISSRKTSINLWQMLSRYWDFKQYIIEEFNFDIEKWWNTKVLENYFLKRWKEINLEKYKKLQIEIKDVFYLEQFFLEYENLEENDWKLELTEKFLKGITNKNWELTKFEIEEIDLFNLFTTISEFLYKSNSLLLEKEKIKELIPSLSIQENKRKLFLDYILKTFFIESEWKYSFYHKTFYEYFLVRYISEEYSKNKLSIREWNILSDGNFIKKWFFPYLQRKYIENENYPWIVGLNLFMDYYLRHNPIDEIKPEIFIKWLFDLPEDILRGYIFEKTSPIYNWFNGFYYLNFCTIKIALEKWYKDIADGFYDKLNNLLEEKAKEEKNLIEKIWKLDKNDEKYNFNFNELDQELNHLFDWINFKNQADVKIYYEEFNSYFDLYKKIKLNYEIDVFQRIEFTSYFFDSPYYAFFDNLLKYWKEEEILNIINEFEKIELYAFLQVGLKLENIRIILWNQNILNLIKEKFTFFRWDFKEFINYNKDDLKIEDSAITLFFKYVFWLYVDEKEIFESEDFKELKEWSNWFFNIHGWFYESNLNNSQLASYIFIEEINFDMKENHHLSQSRIVYQYSYYLYLKSILNNEKIKFDEYLKDTINYLNNPNISSNLNININIIYSEILAYIFYYNVEWDYWKNVNLIWDNLSEFIDEINFYKTLHKLDKLNKTDKLLNIINAEKITFLKNNIERKFDYPASDVENYIFISQLYWLYKNKDLQIKSFDIWIAHSYVKYGFRKDYYLTYVFEILEDLKHNSVITEEKTFEYLNWIIDLYWKIDWITEKWVAYLWKNIINFLLTFSLDKALEYKEKINSINSNYYDEIETSILIQKIKTNIFTDHEIENLYFHDSRTSLLELKIYLYLVDIWRDDFIDKVNILISLIKNETHIYYYWNEEDFELYDKLYKLWKVNKSESILKELKKPEREINETFSLKDLNNDDLVKFLNDKVCYWMYHTSFWWDYNYLLSELYRKDKKIFNLYISRTNFKYDDKYEYEFFTNIQWLTKVYIENKERDKVILLFEELLSFAWLLIK
jgi:hypothetical protein